MAWVATKPRTNPSAPLSPFAMPQYRLARVGRFIQRADNYSLAVVLFAAALFFAGISTRLDSPTVPRQPVRVGRVSLGASPTPAPPYTATWWMMMMSMAKIASDQNGYAGIDSSAPIALRLAAMIAKIRP